MKGQHLCRKEGAGNVLASGLNRHSSGERAGPATCAASYMRHATPLTAEEADDEVVMMRDNLLRAVKHVLREPGA